MCNARSGGSGRKMTTSGPISGVSVGSNSSGGQSAIASEWFSWFAQHRNLGKKGQHTQVGWQTFFFISSSLVETLVWKKNNENRHHQLGASKFLHWCFVKQKVLSINRLCRAQRMAPNEMGRIKNCRHPLCFGTTGADAQRVNVVQKLRKKARHRFFEENRGLFLPGSSRIGTTLPKNRDHPQYILQTLPMQKSDLISFISFWFWHLSTLSEKLQLKENDGLFFFWRWSPAFPKQKGSPSWTEIGQSSGSSWTNGREESQRNGGDFSHQRKNQFFCCLQWVYTEKNTLAQWFMAKFGCFGVVF